MASFFNTITKYFILTVVIFSTSSSCATIQSDKNSDEYVDPSNDEFRGLSDYLMTDDLYDGEHEFRLQYRGVSAKQTAVGPSEGSPG